MKKILFVLLAVAVFSNVQAQYDTIWKCPYLYHYNWPETGIYYDDSVYCTFCFVQPRERGRLVLPAVSCPVM